MENAKSISVENLLEHDAFNYLLFQNILGNEPNREQLNAFDDDLTWSSLEMVGIFADTEYRELVNHMRSWFRSKIDEIGFDALIKNLSKEYFTLFIGPSDLVAPPWESMYLSNEKSLFSEVTLNVRNEYRKQGFLPAGYPKVADDHIALELGFMAQLSNKAFSELQSNMIPEAKQTISASLSFLKEHLLVWSPRYVSDITTDGSSEFYCQLCRLILRYMTLDSVTLDYMKLD